MRAFGEWLYETDVSVAIHSTLWLIRVLQATHLLAAGVAAGTGVVLALRALGRHRADEPFEAVWTRYAPWLTASLAVMIATGLAQTLGDPVRAFTATSYWLKLALLAFAVAGTRWLASADRRSLRLERSSTATVVAVSLILAWLAIAMLGRMIGYDLAIFGSWSLRT